jgi:hypothetical protein
VIRDFQPDDAPALQEIHGAQGFDYQFPDLSDPLFLVKKVREEDGRVKGLLCLRITAEAFLIVDGSDFEKARAIEELQPEVDHAAFKKGLSDYVAVVPPEIAEAFGPVMERMGWERDRQWPKFYRSVKP